MTVPRRAYLGLDVGAETVKAVVLNADGDNLSVAERRLVNHAKHPHACLRSLLSELACFDLAGGAITGRLADMVDLPAIPVPKATVEGFWFYHPEAMPACIVTIGGRGFSVLEAWSRNRHLYHRNGRCSQGTGNFLSQLTGKFGLSVEEADARCAKVGRPAALSGRCPVILKTDMTHLANRGESTDSILAGLFDAVADNVQSLVKPGMVPPDVYLAGGVSRSARLRARMEKFLSANGMRLCSDGDGDNQFYEATGAALEAMRKQPGTRPLVGLLRTTGRDDFTAVPPLRAYLDRVTVMPAPPARAIRPGMEVVLGLDIGSTGSKAVALELERREPVWESFRLTRGNPVDAAQALVAGFIESTRSQVSVKAIGVTGSGRGIVGSLLNACCGYARVFVLNEIAAHAEGALYYDSRVDTIFEIGGQDAKYIRLSGSRVYDSAMNEACSAGTGSFIEEQGERLSDVPHVGALCEMAIGAERGMSLGQHCSVFMAEVIDNALSAGKATEEVVAGIFDSVIQNYLNRVKGSRSIGERIFCQGMPFSSVALAAAVARQTGRQVVVPPSPGTVGSLGIALLADKNLAIRGTGFVELESFAASRVTSKDTFTCASTRGCGAPGNRCRIDRLKVAVAGETRQWLWGGSCALYDQAAPGKAKLPDHTPNAFRERAELLRNITEQTCLSPGRGSVGITCEFILDSLFPFFSTFIHELGFDTVVLREAGRDVLKRGVERGPVAMCAPMQMYGGVLSALVDAQPDHVFIPMLRNTRRIAGEPHAALCPLSQASADIFSHALRCDGGIECHMPVIDIGTGNLESDAFLGSIRSIARDFGIRSRRVWRSAYVRAMAAQEKFDHARLDIGRRALRFAAEHEVMPVVVLGRGYTIHNDVLNANVPAILGELGTLAIPEDCYPVTTDVPVCGRVYWGHTQRMLRAAGQIRQTAGHYSVFCTNYSCGPDGFNLHFYSRIMEGKPFCIIETDGHTADAGTRTRLEAFLYCASAHEKQGHVERVCLRDRLRPVQGNTCSFADVRRRNERLLIPRMGESATALAAALRGDGFRAEALPVPNQDTLALGRRFTSGKECLPAVVTLGSILQEAAELGPHENMAFFMPSSDGPCRFGMYHMLDRLVLETAGYGDRVHIVSPRTEDYFDGLSTGLALKVFAAFVADDLLRDALLDVRPVEKLEGAANRTYAKWHGRLEQCLASEPAPRMRSSLGRVATDIFGLAPLLSSAAAEFADIKDFGAGIPTVALVGEIYVRLDPFSNDSAIDKLEARGVRAKLAPLQEWIEYVDFANRREARRSRSRRFLSLIAGIVPGVLRATVQNRLHGTVADRLKWPARPRVESVVSSAKRYLQPDLLGEAVLTLGYAIHECDRATIDGALSVGPLECMPNKAAEAQFFHVTRDLGLPCLTLSLNGEPMDTEALDNFVYDVKRRFDRVQQG